MARDWSKDRSPGKEGAARRLPGSGGAIRQVFGVIGRKLAGKSDGWNDDEAGGDGRPDMGRTKR